MAKSDPDAGLVRGDDDRLRCFWSGGAVELAPYHDSEWGFPVTDDRRLFEKISLEGFQAGLSWLTILRKRPAFRLAFADFDFEKIARFPAAKVDKLLGDAGIVRHRGKIESVLNNARRACALVEERGSIAGHVWSFEPAPASRPPRMTRAALMGLATSAESTALSKDLKRRGWSFVGPTTLYAFMQAMGLVNDHLDGCHVREAAEQARRKLARPRAAGNSPASPGVGAGTPSRGRKT
jgi:DNA-3-methyladenine glycosylase I